MRTITSSTSRTPARLWRASSYAGTQRLRHGPSRCTSSLARRRRTAVATTAIFGGLASAVNSLLDGRPSKAHKTMDRLLSLLKGTNAGVTATPEQKAGILACVDELQALGAGENYTKEPNLQGTWRLLYTTEKEILFILQNAGVFKRRVTSIYQVLDLHDRKACALYNSIVFRGQEPCQLKILPISNSQPLRTAVGDGDELLGGSFFVTGTLKPVGLQRLKFSFVEANLTLGTKYRAGNLWLPPFGSGWFDVVYMDARVRVSRDSRGDTSVLMRLGDIQMLDDGDIVLEGLSASEQ